MTVKFEDLPAESRVWIYQSSKPLDDVTISSLSSVLENFTNNWQSHGNPVRSSFSILRNRFIILAADEGFEKPSGCSIDSSVALMKEIEEKFNLSLLDRSLISYIDNEEVKLIDLKKVNDAIKANQINKSTLIFNNHITTKQQLQEVWVVNAENSWLSRYF